IKHAGSVMNDLVILNTEHRNRRPVNSRQAGFSNGRQEFLAPRRFGKFVIITRHGFPPRRAFPSCETAILPLRPPPANVGCPQPLAPRLLSRYDWPGQPPMMLPNGPEAHPAPALPA